ARVSIRGDQVTLAGDLDAVEWATRVATAMIDLARMGELVT
ncbi:MAG: PhoH family protein, partial [Gemmatimonadetes bacterium]|nr:PhoH family protein [Gemmatimonadota bacterium]NIV22189.1 PhoH family protein [Gemmatimonadota bacterium]NIW74506.1 PhoH family protein [Gemmatimonadota bacterium]